MAGNGTIFPLTVDFGETPIPILPLIVQGINVQGSAGASKGQLLKMLKFVVQHNIRPTIMKFPLTRDGVEEALKTLSEGNMRYRGVLVAT
jgi:D-arabinose 1-dehydrogenase-like Zn-dependent alcohol dehydrogenase